MASQRITLKIVPFKNPGDSFAYRVTGSILGIRLQKNFPTHEEAEAFMNGLVRTANQADSPQRERITSTTFPTDAALRDAEAAHRQLQLAFPGESLLAPVNYYLRHATRPITDLPAHEALDKYLKRRRERGNQERTIDVCEDVLRLFLRRLAIGKISEFTREAAEEFVFDGTVVARTRRDRRDLLFNWAKFLTNQGHLAHNVVETIERPKIERAEPTTFRIQQVQRLLDCAAIEPAGRKRQPGAMLPYFAICVLSGMRPDETKRLAGHWEKVSFEHGVIHGFKAKRLDRTRTVEISDNLRVILRACKERGLAPGFFSEKAFDGIRKKADMYGNWDNDILRHTYASHHYAWKRDIGFLVKNMGNSEDVLNQSYLNRQVLASEGEALFGYIPTKLS